MPSYYIHTPTQEFYDEICQIIVNAGYKQFSQNYFPSYSGDTAVGFEEKNFYNFTYCSKNYYRDNTDHILIPNIKTLKNLLTTGKFQAKLRIG